MTRDGHDVKVDEHGDHWVRRRGVVARVAARWARCLEWIDVHPRTGWYVALLLTFDVVLSVVDLWNGG